jgi:hypothetical protein
MLMSQPPEPSWLATAGFLVQTAAVCLLTFFIGRWLRQWKDDKR